MQNTSFVSNLYNGISKQINKVLINENKKANLNWLKIKQLKHFTPGKIRKYKYHDRNIFYSEPQDFLHSLKEIFVEEIYHVTVPDHAYILDCGSNIGLSVIYLKEKHPDAHIIAFEPDRKNFGLLEKNIGSFGFTDVILEEKAVWVSDTRLSFRNDGNMGSKIEPLQTGKNNFIEAVQLKKYINRKVDFLKIDIEGAEYEVLRDIRSELTLVQNMFFEYHGNFSQNNELVNILEIIQTSGFKFYIKEAANVYRNPFLYQSFKGKMAYDIQLNIFCFR